MIRNIIYSLSFHFFIVLTIFFGLKKFEILPEFEISGVSVSIATPPPEPKPDPEPAPLIEEPKPKKEAPPPPKKPKKIEKKPKKVKKITKKVKKTKKITKKPKKTTPQIRKITQKPIKTQEIFKNIKELEQTGLSAREKYNIKTQLNSCFRRALRFKPKEKIDVTVRIRLAKNGQLILDKEQDVDYKKYQNDKNYQKMVDRAIIALDFCSHFRNLKPEKYQIWQKFKVRFKN